MATRTWFVLLVLSACTTGSVDTTNDPEVTPTTIAGVSHEVTCDEYVQAIADTYQPDSGWYAEFPSAIDGYMGGSLTGAEAQAALDSLADQILQAAIAIEELAVPEELADMDLERYGTSLRKMAEEIGAVGQQMGEDTVGAALDDVLDRLGLAEDELTALPGGHGREGTGIPEASVDQACTG